MKKLIFATILCAHIAFIQVNQAQAVSFSSSLSPAVQHLLIKPGVNTHISYQLHNTGDPITLQMKLAKVQPDNESYIVSEITESSVSFSDPNVKNPFIMTSNERKTIDLAIFLPPNVAQSDYYFAVIAETVPQPAAEGKTTIQLQGSTSSLLFLTVKENADLDFSPKIALFDTKPKVSLNFFGKKYNIFDTSDQIPVVLTVQNQGMNAFQAEGWITLSGGKETMTYPLTPKYLLSSGQSTLVSPLSVECQTCTQPSSLVLPKQKTGIYELKTVVTVGKQGKGVPGTTQFIVLPIKLLLATFTIAASIPFLLLFYIKKKQK